MQSALDLGTVFELLRRATALRAKRTPTHCDATQLPSLPPAKNLRHEFRKGLSYILDEDGAVILEPSGSVEEYYDDMAEIFRIRTDGSVGTFCYHRLRLLETKFELYLMQNFDLEQDESSSVPHRDFYNVRKVDTHIHHSAAMNAKHLLRFIKKKVRVCGTDEVLSRSGKPVTLSELFDEMKLKAHDLCLDKLNVTADQTVFNRFDRFNQKYNPLEQPDLRTVFLKTDNHIKGRYLAELTRELLDDLEESKYQHTEWRLSIYGRKHDEWEKLSRWVLDNKLVEPYNRWMIQIPRLFSIYSKTGQLQNFQQMLDNIFEPMFSATLKPESHPEIAAFLLQISGFDTVDDESKSNEPGDRTFSSRDCSPEDWDFKANPSYKYYNFYLQSNLVVLNRLRACKGLNQFNYRPHAGEAGELHHLDTAFLLADGIAHGLNLRKSTPLQYLYYLCEIGIYMSPCSNNFLFLSYQKTPFHEFFMRGLNVSVSTDDPLMFHQTKEPLMEEYSLVKQFFRLSSVDLCELARNSVLQSGFLDEEKIAWIGSTSRTANDMLKTNVPNCRIRHRTQCHNEEMEMLRHASHAGTMEAYQKGIPSTKSSRDLVVQQQITPKVSIHNFSVPQSYALRLVDKGHKESSVDNLAPVSQDVIPRSPPITLPLASLRVPNMSPERTGVDEVLEQPPRSPMQRQQSADARQNRASFGMTDSPTKVGSRSATDVALSPGPDAKKCRASA